MKQEIRFMALEITAIVNMATRDLPTDGYIADNPGIKPDVDLLQAACKDLDAIRLRLEAAI